MTRRAHDTDRRQRIAAALREGLATEWQERAYTSDAVNAKVARLRALAADDLPGRLAIAGFTLTPFRAEDIEQSCATCMYFLIHRRYCGLPELDLPVEAEWSCNLWRI